MLLRLNGGRKIGGSPALREVFDHRCSTRMMSVASQVFANRRIINVRTGGHKGDWGNVEGAYETYLHQRDYREWSGRLLGKLSVSRVHIAGADRWSWRGRRGLDRAPGGGLSPKGARAGRQHAGGVKPAVDPPAAQGGPRNPDRRADDAQR